LLEIKKKKTNLQARNLLSRIYL